MVLSTETLIDVARAHFLSPPYHHVRLPEAVRSARSRLFNVDAVFTRDGARPRWDNLGLIVHRVRSSADDSLELWQERFAADLPAPAALLSETDSAYLLLKAPQGATELVHLPVDDRLARELAQRASHFAPREIAAHRRGQLSFADTAFHLTPGTLEFASRHRIDLHRAMKNAITEALSAVPARHTHLRSSVFRFALAYLGARVLEDKGFFEEQRRGVPLANDPRELLGRTVARTNGFLQKAYEEALPPLEQHPAILTAISKHLGPATTFALVDHRDVGRLYEELIDALRNGKIKQAGPQIRDIAQLQQHYTPMALTEQILAHLPLERIRPEKRFIFDPTAGSGSFLLAATQRLAAMTDLPDDPGELKAYLESHVVGNDSDPNVMDIAYLRYRLVQESEQAVALFPPPSRFGKERYQDFKKETLGFSPAVLVANPPYAEQGGEQEAARFVKHTLDWLDDGAQFALVLPQTFLVQSSHTMADARRKLSRRAQILEVWQLPSGAVGLSADQDVCVVMGIVGGAPARATVARALFSRAEAKRVRDDALLGASWLSALDEQGGGWESVCTPPVHLSTRGPLLSDVFHVFTGPTPEKGAKPAREPQGSGAAPYFSFEWVGDRLWADPERRPEEARWMNRWKRKAKRNAEALGGPKLIVSNSTNRGSKNPFRVCYDDRSHWPDRHHHCISSPGKNLGTSAPKGIEDLSAQERLFWLIGILSSSIAVQLVLGRRGARSTGMPAWSHFPLPLAVDPQIVQLVREVIAEEQADRQLTPFSSRQEDLEALVRRSYGNPRCIEIPRTGPDHFNDQLAAARKETSGAIVGQVVDFARRDGEDKILLHISGLSDESEAWVPLPFELPGWALDGTSFVATVPLQARDHQALQNRAALRSFQHPPRAYESLDELFSRMSDIGVE